MRIRGLAVLVFSVLMVGLTFYPQGAAERTEQPKAGDGTAVILHFKGEGFTSAAPAPGNATEETKDCPGRSYGGRRSGSIIGEWAFTPTRDFQMQGSFKAELWAKSDSGAKNAGFRLNLYEGSNLYNGYFSERLDITTPHKFIISDTATLTCRAGVQVVVGLVWLSDPNYVVGPSSGGKFLYGGKDHDSTISITLADVPVAMNITSVEKERDAIKISSKVNESLGMPIDALTYSLMIQGPAAVAPGSISNPSVTGGENGTSVSWLWNFKNSKAQSGTYTLTMTVAYSNETSFTNASQVQITFEVAPVTDVIKNLTTGSNLFILIGVIALVAIAVAAVSFIMLRRRRLKKARLKSEGEPAAAAV